MSVPHMVETVTRVPVEWAFEFNRELDHVWAAVQLGFGVVLTVSSGEPHSPRDWTLEEIDVPHVQLSRAGTLLSAAPIPYESELGRALAKAWDNYVSREARAAVYTHENRGSPQNRKETP